MMYYAPISKRIKALFIDGILLAVWLLVAIVSITNIELVNPTLEASFILLTVASVEPLLTSFTGATVGQHICGITVKRSKNRKNLSIVTSYIRYFLKLPLGIFSLLTVNTTIHYQAIHDLLCRSVVIHKYPDKAPNGERLLPRTKPSEEYTYPSVLRRIVAILLYLLLSFIALLVISNFGISESCINNSYCSEFDQLTKIIISAFFYINIFAFVTLGWRSKLWGCRKHPIRMPT